MSCNSMYSLAHAITGAAEVLRVQEHSCRVRVKHHMFQAAEHCALLLTLLVRLCVRRYNKPMSPHFAAAEQKIIVEQRKVDEIQAGRYISVVRQLSRPAIVRVGSGLSFGLLCRS